MVIIGLVVIIVGLIVAFLFINDIVSLPKSSKYKSGEEATGATVGIGTGVEKIGSILEEIDEKLT